MALQQRIGFERLGRGMVFREVLFIISTMNGVMAVPTQIDPQPQLLAAVQALIMTSPVQFTWNQVMKRQGQIAFAERAGSGNGAPSSGASAGRVHRIRYG